MKTKQGRAFVIQSNFGNSILGLINIENYLSNFEILLPKGIFKGESYRPTVVWDNPEAARRYITFESTPISCDIKTGLITRMPEEPLEVTYTATYMGNSLEFTVTLLYEKKLSNEEIQKIYLIGPSTISCAEPTTYLIYTYPLGVPIDLDLVTLEDLDNNTNVSIDGLTVTVSEALNNNTTITLKASYGEFETKRNINLLRMSKYIKFKDPEVERLCIQRWSHNGLGVTFDDIKDVTSLSGAFRNNTSITSFNELKYFKSLRSIDGLFRGCINLSSLVIPFSILEVNDLRNCNLAYLGMANDFTNSVYTSFGSNVLNSTENLTVVLNNNLGALADGFLDGTTSVIGYLNTTRIVNLTVTNITKGLGGNGFSPLYLRENLVPIYNNTLYWKRVGSYEAYDFEEDSDDVLSPCDMTYDWYWGPENGLTVELPTLPANFTEIDYVQGGGNKKIELNIACNKPRLVFDMYNPVNNSIVFLTNTGNWALNPDGGFYYRYGLSGWNFSGLNVGTWLNTWVSCDMSNEVIVNGELKGTCGVGNWNGEQIHLLGPGWNGSSGIKLKNIKLYNNGELVGDYITCKNENNVEGLYNLLNLLFYPLS